MQRQRQALQQGPRSCKCATLGRRKKQVEQRSESAVDSLMVGTAVLVKAERARGEREPHFHEQQHAVFFEQHRQKQKRGGGASNKS